MGSLEELRPSVSTPAHTAPHPRVYCTAQLTDRQLLTLQDSTAPFTTRQPLTAASTTVVDHLEKPSAALIVGIEPSTIAGVRQSVECPTPPIVDDPD